MLHLRHQQTRRCFQHHSESALALADNLFLTSLLTAHGEHTQWRLLFFLNLQDALVKNVREHRVRSQTSTCSPVLGVHTHEHQAKLLDAHVRQPRALIIYCARRRDLQPTCVKPRDYVDRLNNTRIRSRQARVVHVQPLALRAHINMLARLGLGCAALQHTP